MTRYSASRGIMYTTPPAAEDDETEAAEATATADGSEPATADD